MRTLTRPMFNMGGPIKQGIMHGIREPKNMGGRMLLVGQHPKEFQDKSGREKHLAPLALVPWIARAIPMAYRGFKAARTFAPGKLGKWGRLKDIISPSGRFRTTTTQVPKQGNILTEAQIKAGMIPKMESSKLGILQALKDPTRFGAAVRENPLTAFAAASSVPQAGYLGYKAAKAAPGAIWEGTKRYADMVIPGDQSRWWKDKEPPTAVPLNPNLQATIKAAKELSGAKKKEFALKQREDRVNKYLKMMGYDRAKKTAIADALIDASKIVSDRGTLDLKNIGTDLINPIIQATSKRLDKPEQIREAVGLMATKAEIEKDLEDPSIKALRLEQLKELRGGFEKDVGDFILSAKGTKVKPDALERYARIKANEYGIDFTKITDETVTNAAGTTEEEKIQNVVGDDGIYMIGDAIIKVTGGIPKHIG